MNQSNLFKQLFEVLYQRKSADVENSYVAKLYKKGVPKINGKIIEEASEACEAALTNDKKHLTYEICDLIFHTFVMAAHKNISFEDIEQELKRRYGTSGLEEKKHRENK